MFLGIFVFIFLLFYFIQLYEKERKKEKVGIEEKAEKGEENATVNILILIMQQVINMI